MKLKTALEGIGQGGHQEKYAQHRNRAESYLTETREAGERGGQGDGGGIRLGCG